VNAALAGLAGRSGEGKGSNGESMLDKATALSWSKSTGTIAPDGTSFNVPACLLVGGLLSDARPLSQVPPAKEPSLDFARLARPPYANLAHLIRAQTIVITAPLAATNLNFSAAG
jgi:hypothetical protein